jgi:hypothetical protein
VDIYRVAAARLSEQFETVEVREIDLAALALRDLPEAEAKELHEAARRQRVMAAPYELKLALKGALRERYRERSGDDESPVGARGETTEPESPAPTVALGYAAE